MGPTTSITTFLPLADNPQSVRDRIADLFSAIGFTSPEGTAIPSAAEFAAALDEGAYYFPQRIIFAGGVGFVAAAGLYVYGGQDHDPLTTPVVELDLDLVTAQLYHSPGDVSYQARVVGGLWALVRTWGGAVPEAGAYLDADIGIEELKDLLFGVGQTKQQWAFDLALVSHPLARHFAPIPSTFQRAALPEGIGLARKARWPVTPWEAQMEDSETPEAERQGQRVRGRGQRQRFRGENLRT